MKRLLLPLSLTALVYGCQESQSPTLSDFDPPSFAISDGANGGTAGFYFLQPLVEETPAFSGVFLPGLPVTYEVCRLDSEPIPACIPGTLQNIGTNVPDDGSSHYIEQWHTGNFNLPNGEIHRILVRVGLNTELGFRDVKPVATPQEVPNPQTVDLYVFLNGSTIPIKTRIEKVALCEPGVSPDECGAGGVNLANGGAVSAPNGNGVEIFQTSGPDGPVAISVQPCPTMMNLPIDNPKYGPCLWIQADPPLPPGGLIEPALVQVCSDLDLPPLASHDQEGLITLHRMNEETGQVDALPHQVDNCSALAALQSNPVMRLAAVGWSTVRDGVGAWIIPAPLSAAPRLRRLDIGRGGASPGFSFFQMALPVKMEKVAATDNQTTLAGTAVDLPPAVHVTDFNGEDAAGATVHFEVLTASGGTVQPMAVVSDANGMAQVNLWELSSVPGVNQLKGSGFGIADPVTNGPAPGFDPFAPERESDPSLEIPADLATGMVTFTAIGCAEGFGTPSNIDGINDPDEWECALEFPFDANLSGGSSTSARLLIMNDLNYLYLAVEVERTAFDKVNSLQFNFADATQVDGGSAENDDILLLDSKSGFNDRFLTLKCTNSSQTRCGAKDARQDGSGMVTNDGTHTFYEIVHPLNSGDPNGNDFALAVGDAVKLYWTLLTGNGATGNTQLPGFRIYQEITVVDPATF